MDKIDNQSLTLNDVDDQNAGDLIDKLIDELPGGWNDKKIVVIGYPNDRVRGKIRELRQRYNLPMSSFINVGIDCVKVQGLRGCYFVDTGCGNDDQLSNYERTKDYIHTYNLLPLPTEDTIMMTREELREFAEHGS